MGLTTFGTVGKRRRNFTLQIRELLGGAALSVPKICGAARDTMRYDAFPCALEQRSQLSQILELRWARTSL